MKLSAQDIEQALNVVGPDGETVETMLGKQWFDELVKVARPWMKKRGFILNETPLVNMFPEAGYRKFYTEKGSELFIKSFFQFRQRKSLILCMCLPSAGRLNVTLTIQCWGKAVPVICYARCLECPAKKNKMFSRQWHKEPL